MPLNCNTTSIRILIILICTLFCRISIYAAEDNLYRYHQISLNDGLANYRVTSITEDSFGTYWIGTRSGLNRIIGKSIKTYIHNPADSSSIAGNNIINVLNDKYNNIWVLCLDGLSKYNQIKDNFNPVNHQGKQLKIYSFCKIANGILFGGNGVVYKYNYKDDKFEVVYKTSGQHKFIIDNIICLKENLFIISVNKVGLLLLDTLSSEVSLLFSTEKNIWSRAVFMDSHNKLWIPIFNYGVISCNIDISEKKLINIKENTFVNFNIKNCSPMSLIEIDNEVWVGFDGDGIYAYDRIRDQFRPIPLNENIHNSPLASIYCLYVDSNDKVWAGTVHGGVISIKHSFIKNLIAKQDAKSKHFSVSTIYPDPENRNRIWIGFDSGGISVFDSENKTTIEIGETSRLKVVSIVRYSNDELLFAAYDDGLYTINTKTLKIKPFVIKNERLHKELFSQQSLVMLARNNNNIRVLSKSKVYAINGQNISPINWMYEDRGIQHIPFGHGMEMRYSILGNMIIDLYDSSTDILVKFQNKNVIQSATTTKNGEILFCDTEGLKEIVDNDANLIHKLFEPINSMLVDNQNRVWIFSPNYTYCYDLNLKKMKTLDISDGVIKTNYARNAVCTDNHNNIFFGGIDVLSMIDSNVTFATSKKQKISVISLLVDNNRIANRHRLHLPYNFTELKLEFAIQNMDILSYNDTYFTLESNDNNIKMQAKDNTLTIYNLPSDEYKLKYSYLNKDGLLHEDTIVLDFIVNKPWWLSIYSILLLTAVISSSIYYVIYYKNRKKDRELRWMLREKEKKLSEDRAKFLINISHELRTPLTLIYSPLKSLLSDTQISNRITNKELQKLQNIFHQVRNMFQLINLVLDTRHIGGNECCLNLERKDFNQWIYSVCDEFKLLAEDKGIPIVYELSPDIDTISFDVDKCKVALSNLLMNAIKYGEHRGIITIKSEIHENNIRISVSDCGNGIDNDKKDKIFNRYYQGSITNEGYGIGLSYTKMLIELHGGIVDCYNNTEMGATFFFEIPITTNDKEFSFSGSHTYPQIHLPQTDTTYNNDTESSCTYMSALIVDDEKDILELIKECISPYFKKIYTASDGNQALIKAKSYLPDVIISDIMMPNMDGYELCNHIKTNENTLHIPVILLTARADVSSIGYGYRIGADNYISKPFDIDILRSIILSTIRNKENLKQRIYSINVNQLQTDTSLCNAEEEFIIKLNRYIETNIANEKLNLSDIADHMNMSRSLLHNKMKTILGTNISTYINNIRIERSKRLLTSKNESLSNIAYEVGFSSHAYFSTVFKKYVGMSPASYRSMIETTNSNIQDYNS